MDNMQSVLAAVAICTPMTLAVVQGVKNMGLPDRWAPALALLCGLVMIALCALAEVVDLTWGQTALTGVLTGLSSAGLYSGVRATVNK